jgi:hypothetical protein
MISFFASKYTTNMVVNLTIYWCILPNLRGAVAWVEVWKVNIRHAFGQEYLAD